MMRFQTLFGLITCLLFFSCNNRSESESKNYNFKTFDLFTNPKKLSHNYPSLFVYKSAKIIRTGNFGDLVYNRQGVIVMQTDDETEVVLAYYKRLFGRKKWQIIQSNVHKNNAMIMAESSSRQLITVILREQSPVTIKLYFKQTGIL